MVETRDPRVTRECGFR